MKVHVKHPTDVERAMCGKPRRWCKEIVPWDPSSITTHETVTCLNCLKAYDAERQREHDAEVERERRSWPSRGQQLNDVVQAMLWSRG